MRKISQQNIIEFAEVEFQPRHPKTRPWPTDMQPREIHVQGAASQPGDLQFGCDQAELSKISDSEDENNVKLKVVYSKRPIISRSRDVVAETAELCVIAKSEDSQRENLVKVDIADFI